MNTPSWKSYGYWGLLVVVVGLTDSISFGILKWPLVGLGLGLWGVGMVKQPETRPRLKKQLLLILAAVIFIWLLLAIILRT